jgi:hypothetical protein
VWRETPQFRKVDYKRVELASARLLSVRSEWPAETRWIADLFLSSPEAEGVGSLRTPRFIIASRERNAMIYTAWGTEGWRSRIKPWLDQNVGT